MRHIKNKVVRVLVAVAAIALLLFPGWLMATVFTSLNFVVALMAILVSVLTAIWLPRWKWISAVAASLLIAVPPYPYWVYVSIERGWYLHFFHGFTLHDLPLLTFATVFTIALLLFKAIFWAIGSRPRQKVAAESTP